jgi:hypothetical protein
MSESDAVPLPREGEVFFDVRGDARTMRLSWYADSKVAVFSIWQGNRCTGTFRLPFADLTRMIETLEAGPQSQVPGPGSGGHQGLGYPDSGFGDSADYGHSQDYGRPAYGQPYGAGYGPADYGGSGGDQGYRGYGSDQAPAAARGYSGEYQDAFDRDRSIGAEPRPSYSARPHRDDQFDGRSDYSAQPSGPGQPHSASQPYGEPYGGGQPYDTGQPYGPAQQYGPPRHYDPAQPYGPAQSSGSGTPYSSGQRYRAGEQYGVPTQQHGNYGPPDYDPPNHGDLGTGRDSDRSAGPDDQPEAQSVPDTAMLGFPSVPARNGPYR